jgi:hypothetical protein
MDFSKLTRDPAAALQEVAVEDFKVLGVDYDSNTPIESL